jgi:hypothetical protein
MHAADSGSKPHHQVFDNCRELTCQLAFPDPLHESNPLNQVSGSEFRLHSDLSVLNQWDWRAGDGS